MTSVIIGSASSALQSLDGEKEVRRQRMDKVGDDHQPVALTLITERGSETTPVLLLLRTHVYGCHVHRSWVVVLPSSLPHTTPVLRGFAGDGLLAAAQDPPVLPEGGAGLLRLHEREALAGRHRAGAARHHTGKHFAFEGLHIRLG